MSLDAHDSQRGDGNISIWPLLDLGNNITPQKGVKWVTKG